MGSPDLELPDTLFVAVSFSKFPSRYFVFTGINQRHAGQYSALTGSGNGKRSQFFGLMG